MSNQVDTSHEYIEQKTDNFGGIIVSEGHGTNLPEAAINEFITANKSQKETENNDMNKQSGKADVKVAAQDEKNSRFSPSNIFFIKMNQKEID